MAAADRRQAGICNRDTGGRKPESSFSKLGFIALSMGALMSVLYFYVTRSLTSPLERLMQTISKIRAGATELRADYQANDEIGMLAMEFNNMLDEVEALIGQQYEDKVLLNKAEYKALQAQSGYAEIRYSPG